MVPLHPYHRPAPPAAPCRLTGRIWLLVAVLTGMVCLLPAKPLPAPFGSDYLAENWGLDEGFPENSCSGIVLAPDGAMWLGTFRGLVRFNGQHFAPWAPAAVPELKSASILTMFKDRADRVWFSTTDGLIMHDRGAWKRWQENDGWGARTDLVRSLAEAPDGELVVSRFSGRVLRYQAGGNWKELPTPPGTGGTMCAFDETGVLHAFRHGFAGALRQGEWRVLSGDPTVQKRAVGAGQTRDGRALIVCERELLQVRGGDIVARTPLSQPVSIFWRMTEDPAGTLWLPAVKAGVYRIGKEGAVRQLLKADGLPSSGPTRVVFAADDGSVWIGCSVGGLTRLRPRRFRHIGEAEGLADHVILTLAPLPDGRVLLTSYGTGMMHFDGEKSVKPLDTGRLGSSLIRTVVRRRDGSVWLGTANNGLLRLDGPSLTPAASGIFGPSETINTLFEDSRGRLWVGSDTRVAVLEEGVFRLVGPLDGAERVGSTLFAERSDGTVLLARLNQVYACRPGAAQAEPVFRLPEIQQASTLLVDRDDRVWLGTMRHGLHVWQGGVHRTLTAERGLPGDALSSLVQDDFGQLWFGCTRKVVRADPGELWRAASSINLQPSLQLFDQSDGLRDVDFSVATQPCVAKDARGRLWFALLRGAAMIDPATLKLETRAPPVSFESIGYLPAGAIRAVEYPIVDGDPARVLPAGSRLIRIAYTAFDFQAPHKLRFRARLGGERGEWQEMNNESTVSFFELSPGRHTLHVQACGSDGAWNRTGATLAFELEPYYWQTRWFRALIIVALVGAVSGVAGLVARLRIRAARTVAARERRYAEEKEALRRLALMLTESLTLADLGRATAEASRTLLGHDAFLLVLSRPGETADFCPYVEDTPAGAGEPEPQGNFAASVALRLVGEGKPLLVNRAGDLPAVDLATTERWGCLDRRKASLMYAPILWNGRAVGVVSAQSYSPQRYTAHDLSLLQTLGSQCGGAIARLAAEASLQHNEERLRLAMQSARMGSWEIDVRTNTLTASPEAEAVYECAAGTLSGPAANLVDRVPAPAAAELRQLLEDLRAGRRVALDFTHSIVTAAGAEKWFELKARIRQEPGVDHRVRIIGVTADVTARRLVELERAKLEEQLRQSQKLDAIGQLAGGVAHDFNNILAAMMLHLGMLQLSPKLAPEIRQSLEELEREANRAASLTRQLLMYGRRSVLTVKPLDLNEVVDNLLKMLRRLIGENIALRFEGMSGLPLIEADVGMLEQVLVNLVVNARDAMPQGGRLTIGTTVEEVSEAERAARPESRSGRFVCLAVADTGTGMSAETMKHIFEPFFTTKDAGKGTGLGLATVHGIVAQHKGWVKVESKIGEGSTFKVYVPVLEGAVAADHSSPARVPVHGGRETILLVEDDKTLRKIAAMALRSFGYSVQVAANGPEAVALWSRCGSEIDLVLTDMVMPEGMNGLELVEKLRELKPGLKVIVSSGYSTEIIRPGVLAKADVVFLPKPYETTTLAETVRQVLKGG